jgi:hypothetical protein
MRFHMLLLTVSFLCRSLSLSLLSCVFLLRQGPPPLRSRVAVGCPDRRSGFLAGHACRGAKGL